MKTLAEQIAEDRKEGLNISTGDGALPSTFTKDGEYKGKIMSDVYSRSVRDGNVTYKLPAQTPKVADKPSLKFKLPLDTEMVSTVEGGGSLVGRIVGFTVSGFTPDGEEKERLYINRSTYFDIPDIAKPKKEKEAEAEQETF